MNHSTPLSARERFLPHPILSVVLFVVWLILYKSVSPATIVGGIVLGFAIPFFTRRFWPERPKVRQWGTLLRFLPVFVWDVLVANIQVAWLIVNVTRKLRPRWIVIPLEITNPHAIVMLANVISLTPGTVSSEVGPDHKTLLVHSLDVADEAEAIAFIKRRYETPIGKIFA
jgi:multicomponent K+:H+ antiporter subunit E